MGLGWRVGALASRPCTVIRGQRWCCTAGRPAPKTDVRPQATIRLPAITTLRPKLKLKCRRAKVVTAVPRKAAMVAAKAKVFPSRHLLEAARRPRQARTRAEVGKFDRRPLSCGDSRYC